MCDHDQLLAAEFGRVDVDGRHAEQRIVHAKHRDALALAQLGFGVSPLDVVELFGQRPDVVPLRGRHIGGGVHGGSYLVCRGHV